MLIAASFSERRFPTVPISFIATQNRFLLAVGWAMRWSYRYMPTCAGIGYGNFGLGRNIHTMSARASSTEASFFGSALVRAHAAEAYGLKGMRAFVHKSAAPYLSELKRENFVYPFREYVSEHDGGVCHG